MYSGARTYGAQMGLCGDLSEMGQFGIKLKVRFNFA